MKLMAGMVTDIQGFNETFFGIFAEDDRQELLSIWNNQAKRNPNAFISILSPAQKRIVTEWAVQRASYNTVQLIEVLEKFVAALKKSSSAVYPEIPKRKKSGIRSSLKNIIYKSPAGQTFV